jgi:hypothetical protein
MGKAPQEPIQESAAMISRRLMILSVSMSLGLGALALPARAQENYLAQAITDTRAAIDAGKQLESSSFVEHADDAIDHARSAVWQTPVDPIRKGIKYLRKAVKLAKGTNLDKRISKATEQAELALQQFESVKQ